MNSRFLLPLALLGLSGVLAQGAPPRSAPPAPALPASTLAQATPAQPVTVQAEVWADNWFALYVNGQLVKEDSVPITTERSFNAERFTFQTPWPAQLAFVVKDFRENDTGLEYIGTDRQQMGDGGFIAQFTDAQTGQVLAVTDSSARVLVTHHAPTDSACAAQSQPVAGTAPCGFTVTPEPTGWNLAPFDDVGWSAASVFTAAQVSPKDGFNEITWNSAARLIWGPDLQKDNTVLVRVPPQPGARSVATLPQSKAATGTTTSPVTALATSPTADSDAACQDRTARFQAAGGLAQVHCESGALIVESDGLAREPMMVGITAWQQQVPLPQPYQGANAYRLPLHPVPAAQPTPTSGVGAVAVALNGVPVFNPTKPSQGGDQEIYTPQNDPKLIGELDDCGGHSGRGDDYHYHAGPLCLLDKLGEKTGGVVAYALDGYPVMEFHDAGEQLPTDLDACNGHTLGTLGYHYHLTEQAPYVVGCFHGIVTGAFQPETLHVRPAGGPIRATITDFTTDAAGWTRLNFTFNNLTQTLEYRPAEQDCFLFQYPQPVPPRSPGSGTQTHCDRNK